MNKKYSFLLTIFLAIALVSSNAGTVSANPIPVTGPQLENASPASVSAVSLAPFVASVATSGNPNQAAGIFAQGLFAAPIVQQPASAPGFVSTEAEIATQFAMATQYGSIALLAHNYLLGGQFFDVDMGEVLALVYGDGHIQTYRVVEVMEYQALSPNSPYSDFVDLKDPTGQRISVTSLFYAVYAQEGKLVLQTCIEANGEPSWGRLFIIAQPEEIKILQVLPRNLALKHFMQ
ncbi:MAG: hypothetical protein ACYCXH_02155 [Bellilinea sp.]